MDFCNHKNVGEPFPGLFDALRVRSCNPKYFPSCINIRMTHVSLDRAVGEVDVTEATLNAMHVVHGGVFLTLADTVGGVAAATRAKRCNTLSCNMNFLRPGRLGGKIICTAEPEKIGKTICVYRAVITDETGTLLSTGTYTFFVLGELTEAMIHAQIE